MKRSDRPNAPDFETRRRMAIEFQESSGFSNDEPCLTALNMIYTGHLVFALDGSERLVLTKQGFDEQRELTQ